MRRTYWAMGGVLALALGVRVLGLDWGLPQVYEEAYPFKRSWPMWGWGPSAALDLNPHFFNYPTLYFYVQFIGQGLLYVVLRLFGAVDSVLDYRVLYALDKTPFYLMGRSLTVLFAVGTVLVTYRLGAHVRGFTGGLVAALLVAVNHVHITKSQVIEVDVPLTFFLMTCVYYSVRILNDPRPRNYVLAGLFAGLATSTKYSGMLLPLCILLAHAVVVHRSLASAQPPQGLPANEARRTSKGRGARRRRSGHGAVAVESTSRPGGIAAFLNSFVGSRSLRLAGLVSMAALAFTSPYILLDSENFWVGFNYERAHMRIGHFGQDDSSTILYYLRIMTDSLMGWPLTLTSMAAFVYLVFVRRHAWAAIVCLFPVVYLTLISTFTMRAERYILPLMPLACVLSAAFVMELFERARAPLARRAGLAAAAVGVILALPSVLSFAADRSRLRDDNRTLARQWIEANVPPGAYIASEAYGPEPLSVIELAGLHLDVRERLQEKQSEVPIYAMAPIPMLQVLPELMGVFYEIELYEGLVDYIVTSGSVSSRYRKDPEKFANQVTFYEELERNWEMVQSFGPSEGTGPRLHIYRNPHQSVSFAERAQVEPVSRRIEGPPELARSIGGYYQRQGLNLETYGHYPAAVASYRTALGYPVPLPNFHRNVTLGVLRCYQQMGRGEEALRILEATRAAARTPEEAQYWDSVRAQFQGSQ